MAHSNVRLHRGRNTNANFRRGMRQAAGRGRYARRSCGVAPLSKSMNTNVPSHVMVRPPGSGRLRSRSPVDLHINELLMSNCSRENPKGVYNYIRSEPALNYASSRGTRFNKTDEDFGMLNVSSYQNNGEIWSHNVDAPSCSPSIQNQGQTFDLFNQGLSFYNPSLLNAEGNEFCRSRIVTWYNYLKHSCGMPSCNELGNVKVEPLPVLTQMTSTMAQSCSVVPPSLNVSIRSDIIDVDQMSVVSDDSDMESLPGLPVESTLPAIYEPEEGELMEIEQVGGATSESSTLSGSASVSIASNIAIQSNQSDTCLKSCNTSGSEPLTALRQNASFVSPTIVSADTFQTSNLYMSNANLSCTLASNSAYTQPVTATGMTMIEMLNAFSQSGALASQTANNQCITASTMHSNAFSSSPPAVTLNAPVITSQTTARLLSEKRLALVLDLDNTLLQSYPRSKLNCEIDLSDFLDGTNEPELYKFTLALMPEYFYYLKLRPFVRQFLAKLHPYYEFSVYTNATCDYADIVLSILDPDRKYFGDRVAARKERNNVDDPKSIKRLYPDIDVRYVLAFDDRTDVWVDLDRKQVLKAEHYQFLLQNQAKLVESYPVNGGDVSSNFFIPQRVYDFDQHLHFMTTVFQDVHKAFYESPDTLHVGDVLERRKRSVLVGVNIFFTGFLKEGVKGEGYVGAESERLHKELAKEFGASVHAQFDNPAVTHVVALRSTTENYKKCRELTGSNFKRVHSWWLYDCIGTWEKRDESHFDADILCMKTRQNNPACSFQDHWACKWDGVVPQTTSNSIKSKTHDKPSTSRIFHGTGDYSNGSLVISPFEQILITWSSDTQTLGQAKDLATASKMNCSLAAARGPVVDTCDNIGNNLSILENYSNPVDVLTTVESLSAVELNRIHGNDFLSSANEPAWDDKSRQGFWNAGRNLDPIPVSPLFQSKWKVDENAPNLKSSSLNLSFLTSPSTTTSISAAI